MAEYYGQQSTAIPVDDILGEGFPLLPQQIVLAIASSATLVRGTVLGLIATGAAALSAKTGNTGADTGLGSITVTRGANVLPGRYILRCTAAVVADPATPAQWSVTAPNGQALHPAASGVAYAGSHLSLTIGVGTTPWAAGDELYVDVTGSGEAKAYAANAVDGSQRAALILAHDVAVGAAAVNAVAYRTGVFRRAKLTGLDAAAVAQLDARNIFVR
jgi:hypothetical protein